MWRRRPRASALGVTPRGETVYPQPACDPERVAKLARGDERAWFDFLTEYHAIFKRAIGRAAFLRHHQVNSDELDDLLGQLMCAFYESVRRGSFQYYGEASLRCYILTTADHLVVKRLRQGRNHHTTQLVDDAESPALAAAATNHWLAAQTAAGGSRSEALSECLTGLAEPAREVVYLRHLHHDTLSLAEIAAMRSESLAAVEKRHQRALAALRDCIERSARRAGESA